jgi:hypothetical protein
MKLAIELNRIAITRYAGILAKTFSTDTAAHARAHQAQTKATATRFERVSSLWSLLIAARFSLLNVWYQLAWEPIVTTTM